MKVRKIESRDIQFEPGNYSAIIEPPVLYVPQVLFEIAKDNNINNLLDFLSFLPLAPTYIAEELNWKVDQVLEANEILRIQLRGYVDKSLLKKPKKLKRQ
jgi:hypothetical protein